MKQRLDVVLAQRRLVSTRSQAESYIRLGQVKINGQTIIKPGTMVSENDEVKLATGEQYVSRAALKLDSVADALKIDFRNKIVLDVGSSTGGFTDYALKHGANKVIAVEVGTEQMDAGLRKDPRIELHEKTDIRNFYTEEKLDSIVLDVSFISLREILPHVAELSLPQTEIIAMVKPQFEATASNIKHKGVIKNDKMRRDILKEFEAWAQKLFVIEAKADSKVAGAKGNVERFYRLRKL